MQFSTHALIGTAANLSIIPPSPVMSFSPVVLPFHDCLVDMQLRVSVPTTGEKLPIVLLSHGHGQSNWLNSLDGYAPLSEFWAAHGFAILQPTHLDSAFLGLNDTNSDLFFESRADDMIRLFDHLDEIEAAVPEVKGRLDRSKVAVAGHSFGGFISSLLLGANNIDLRDGNEVNVAEKRIKAGVIMAGTGNGGDDLSEAGRNMLPFYGVDFSKMHTPALVVYGENDVSPHLTVRGADWHADPYTLAPGPKDLFTVRDGNHGLGGVSGWDAEENAMDESPERLAAVQIMTWAYMRSQLYENDNSWAEACEELAGLNQLGDIQSK